MYQRVSDAHFAARPVTPAPVGSNVCIHWWQHHGVSRLRIDQTCPQVVSILRGDDVVLERCHVADRWFSRLVGLLGTADLAAGEGLWIAPCASVHTWGMRVAIACVFLDAQGRVLRVVDPLPPRRAASFRGAAVVVETRPGALQTVTVGETLRQAPAR